MLKFPTSASQSQLEKHLDALSKSKPDYIALSHIVQEIEKIVQGEKDVNMQLSLAIQASKAIYQKLAKVNNPELTLRIKPLTTLFGVKRIIQNSRDLKLGDNPAKKILEIMSVFGEQGEDKFDQYVSFAVHGMIRKVRDQLSIEDLSEIYKSFHERKTKEFPTQTAVEKVEAGKNMLEYQQFEDLVSSVLKERSREFLEKYAVIQDSKGLKPFKQCGNASLELKFKEGRGIIVECNLEKPRILDSIGEAVSSIKRVASIRKPKSQIGEASALLEFTEEIEREAEPFFMRKSADGMILDFNLDHLIKYQKQIDPKRTFHVTEFDQLVGKEIDGKEKQFAAVHQ